MLNKLFSFLGFNASENYVGLSHLMEDNTPKLVANAVEIPKKDIKLSDLMRGN